MSAHDIEQHLRRAAAFERAAGGHEDKYENTMKSAGAEMYAGFRLALLATEDYAGRKIDEKAVLRLYQSGKARPWWDSHLTAAGLVAAGVADRERAKRLIQWHVDLPGAQARRAQHVIRTLAGKKRLSAQRTAEHQGATVRPKGSSGAANAAHSDRITRANTDAALAGRELPPADAAARRTTVEDLLGEVARISQAARKVQAGDRDTVLELLRVTAREIERYVP